MAKYKFESSKHLFYWTRKMLDKRNWLEDINTDKLFEASKSLYIFKQENKEIIKKSGLRCPLNQWTYKLYDSEKEEIADTVLSYKTIINDYKKCFDKTTKEIRESKYSKYMAWDDDVFRKVGYYDRSKKEHKLFSEKMLEEMDEILGETGIYKLFNSDRKIIYIGKSHNLGKRIVTSAKDKKAKYYSYAITGNKADTNIYEMYYISKLNPSQNGADNVDDSPSINLPGLNFTNKKKVFQEKGTKRFLENYVG